MPDEHIFNFSANIYYFDDNSFLMNIATQKPPYPSPRRPAGEAFFLLEDKSSGS